MGINLLSTAYVVCLILSSSKPVRADSDSALPTDLKLSKAFEDLHFAPADQSNALYNILDRLVIVENELSSLKNEMNHEPRQLQDSGCEGQIQALTINVSALSDTVDLIGDSDYMLNQRYNALTAGSSSSIADLKNNQDDQSSTMSSMQGFLVDMDAKVDELKDEIDEIDNLSGMLNNQILRLLAGICTVLTFGLCLLINFNRCSNQQYISAQKKLSSMVWVLFIFSVAAWLCRLSPVTACLVCQLADSFLIHQFYAYLQGIVLREAQIDVTMPIDEAVTDVIMIRDSELNPNRDEMLKAFKCRSWLVNQFVFAQSLLSFVYIWFPHNRSGLRNPLLLLYSIHTISGISAVVGMTAFCRATYPNVPWFKLAYVWTLSLSVNILSLTATADVWSVVRMCAAVLLAASMNLFCFPIYDESAATGAKDVIWFDHKVILDFVRDLRIFGLRFFYSAVAIEGWLLVARTIGPGAALQGGSTHPLVDAEEGISLSAYSSPIAENAARQHPRYGGV